MKKFVSNHFSLVLCLSCVLGFVIPPLNKEITVYLIPTLLGIAIFTSFFQVEFTKEALLPDLRKVVVFSTLRYILIPVIVFLILDQISSFYSVVIFIIFMLPAAVSAPAFSNLFNGYGGLAVSTVVFSSILSPLVIPGLCSVFIKDYQHINGYRMFTAVFLTVVLPFILHFPFRISKSFKSWMIDNSSFITVISISALFSISVANYRSQIIANLDLVWQFAIFALVTYIILYIIGWYLLRHLNLKEKITFSVCSGANNIGLGVSLSILYFPADVNIFFIVSNIIWTLVIVLIKWQIRFEDTRG